MLVFRRICPTGVIRGSLVSLNNRFFEGASVLPLCLMKRVMNSWWGFSSALTYIVRNLSILKGVPILPSRGCLNRTGPGEVSRTTAATASSSGASPSRSATLAKMSSARLIQSESLRARSSRRKSGWKIGSAGPGPDSESPPIDSG